MSPLMADSAPCKMNLCTAASGPRNVSGSAKLERRHKIEVTLIDYLELICIRRVIMGAVTG